MNQLILQDIIIKEKPLNLSWDRIQEVIHKAHTDVKKQGGVQISAHLTGEELRQKVGNGVCFVAMYNEEVVGTCSVVIRKKTSWYTSGEAAYYMLDAVLPSFQGFGILSMLDAKREEYVRNHGLSLIYMYTSEMNQKIQRIRKRQGFRLVSFSVSPKTDYYSVVMAKWLNGCPYSEFYCRLRFCITRFYVKLRYREGMIKRIGI